MCFPCAKVSTSAALTTALAFVTMTLLMRSLRDCTTFAARERLLKNRAYQSHLSTRMLSEDSVPVSLVIDYFLPSVFRIAKGESGSISFSFTCGRFGSGCFPLAFLLSGAAAFCVRSACGFGPRAFLRKDFLR